MNSSCYIEKLTNLILAKDFKSIESLCLEVASNNISLEECKDLLVLMEDVPLPYCRYKLYKKLADILTANKSFEEALCYYCIAADLLNDNSYNFDKGQIFNNMGVCLIKLLRYDEAIYYLNSALVLYNSIDMNSDIEVLCTKALYNLSIGYIRVFKLEDALNTVYKAYEKMHMDKSKPIYFKLKIIEANCYDSKKNFNRCIEVYKELIEQADNIDELTLGTIYNNMAIILVKNGSYEESERYFHKAFELTHEIAPEHISHVLIESASLYYETKNMDKFYEVIFKGIKLCRKYNDYHYLIEALMKLERVYEESGQKEKLKEVYLEIIDISEKNSITKNVTYSLNKLISLEISRKHYIEAYKYNDILNKKYMENIINA